MAGGTTSSLSWSSVSPSDAGSYTVVVANPYGTATSDPATLTVVPVVGGVAFADWGNFTLDATGLSGVGGLGYGDSSDFTLDTTGLSGVGGVAYADSGDFTLDTTGLSGVGGIGAADSLDFTLDTTGLSGVGGVAYADSSDFTLDTTGLSGVGGLAYADSRDFTLDTTGLSGVGGIAYARFARLYPGYHQPVGSRWHCLCRLRGLHSRYRRPAHAWAASRMPIRSTLPWIPPGSRESVALLMPTPGTSFSIPPACSAWAASRTPIRGISPWTL